MSSDHKIRQSPAPPSSVLGFGKLGVMVSNYKIKISYHIMKFPGFLVFHFSLFGQPTPETIPGHVGL